jgi:hypothetical protein
LNNANAREAEYLGLCQTKSGALKRLVITAVEEDDVDERSHFVLFVILSPNPKNSTRLT